MRKILIILIGLLWGNMLLSQTLMNRDSLLRLLPNAKEDTALAILYITVGQQYEADSLDVAARYYFKARDLSKKLKFIKGEIKFYTNYTYVLNIKGQYDSALYFNKESLRLASEIKDEYLIAATQGNIAASFMYLTKYDSAIYYQLQALPYMETKGKKQHLMVMLSNLCNLYEKLGQYDKAIEYCKKSIAIARQENDSTNIAIGLTNISNPYLNLRKLQSADSVITEALVISKKIGNKYVYLTSLMNKGDLSIKSFKVKDTKGYAEEALKLSEEIGNPESHSIAQRALAIYYLDILNYPEAKKYANLAYNESVELEDIENQAKNIALLSDVALAMKNMPEHYRYRMLHDSLETIINVKNTNKTVEDLNIKYETEKKDSQLKLQRASIKQKNLLNYLLGGSAFAILAISLLSYRNYKNRKKVDALRINELETEKQLAATEAVLKGEEQERTRLAKDLHDGLGGMLSGIKYSFNTMKGNLVMTPDNAQAFERSMDMLDSSIKEMRRVAHNMMPEALVKFGLDAALKDFCNDINQSGALRISYESFGMSGTDINQSTSITIYRIVQELLNNTMKHAEAKTAIVQLTKEGNQLAITVEDDGKGFDTAILDLSRSGIGWENIRNRVQFLNGKLEVDSLPGKGTTVNIEINS